MTVWAPARGTVTEPLRIKHNFQKWYFLKIFAFLLLYIDIYRLTTFPHSTLKYLGSYNLLVKCCSLFIRIAIHLGRLSYKETWNVVCTGPHYCPPLGASHSIVLG